ncbi:MAG: hypothetical protein JWN86_1451 [Planctomycetota bacterium]|nr:hypothetical protein [Planctomycetota bacterium]
MPETIVKCSAPDCDKEATHKVGSPWQEGSFAELQTLGYTCRTHPEKVVAGILRRPKLRHPAPSEIRIYTLPQR